MGPLELAIVIVILAIAYTISRIAARKGQSQAGFFVFALIIWPLALLVALLIRPRTHA